MAHFLLSGKSHLVVWSGRSHYGSGITRTCHPYVRKYQNFQAEIRVVQRNVGEKTFVSAFNIVKFLSAMFTVFINSILNLLPTQKGGVFNGCICL